MTDKEVPAELDQSIFSSCNLNPQYRVNIKNVKTMSA